jgi:hypothetical protein
MRLTIAGLAGAALLAGTLPGSAQIERIPETSRSEAQSNAISRSLEAQGRSRNQVQQNQFEINSLRNENAIRSTAPIAPPIVVAPIR